MQQPCWAQLTCTTYSGLVQSFVYTETRAHSQQAEMKLCIQVPELIFTFKFVSKNHMHRNIYKQQHYTENILQPQSYVQPLPQKERSQLFYLCCPVRCGIHHLCFSSLWLCMTFFTGWIPHVMILLPRAQMISELYILTCSVECTLTFLLQRNKLLAGIFHPFLLFSP